MRQGEVIWRGGVETWLEYPDSGSSGGGENPDGGTQEEEPPPNEYFIRQRRLQMEETDADIPVFSGAKLQDS